MSFGEYLLTCQASFAGDEDRADVNVGAFQPFLFCQLGEGWYLRSSGVWTYDFETVNYAVPIGLGVGKVSKTERAVINTFIERNTAPCATGRDNPNGGIFAGVNFQFLKNENWLFHCRASARLPHQSEIQRSMA